MIRLLAWSCDLKCETILLTPVPLLIVLLCSCFCCDSRDFVGATSGYSQALSVLPNSNAINDVDIDINSNAIDIKPNPSEEKFSHCSSCTWLKISLHFGFGLMSVTFQLGNPDRVSND